MSRAKSTNRRIIFLGAGASVDAGYPLTARLLDSLEEYCKNSPIQNLKDDWSKFESFRSNATGELKAVLNSANPELVLTVPDLLEACLDQSDMARYSEVVEAAKRGDQAKVDEVNKEWESPVRDKLTEGMHAKLAFQRIVANYFEQMHDNDQAAGAGAKRKYLHKLMGSLTKGDAVITTNWDTLCERVLLAQEKWSPVDGYGFKTKFLRVPRPRRKTGRQTVVKTLPQATVPVLKLHGSVGWYRRRTDKKLYFDNRFLSSFGHAPFSEWWHEIAPPPGSGPNTDPLMIAPSYLKVFDDPVLQKIWGRAAEALAKANEVIFIGYSLPSADSAVRTLLNPLRSRIEARKVVVTIVTPGNETFKNWQTFLGDNIAHFQCTAKDYSERRDGKAR